MFPDPGSLEGAILCQLRRMAVIELIVSVCFIADPGKCKDVHLTMTEGEVTPYQCMMYGQVEITKWLEAQPKWQLKKWSCGAAGRYANL